MEAVLGTSVAIFVGVTVILAGIAAFLMGNAIAETWRPWWHNVVYGALLAFGTQFMTFALFDGAFIVESLVSSEGEPVGVALASYLADAVVLIGISLTTFRLTLSQKMVRQYPWLYERAGLFTWRAKH
jgi:hypothetical protein